MLRCALLGVVVLLCFVYVVLCTGVYKYGVILCICPYVHHSVSNLGRLTSDVDDVLSTAGLISDVEVVHCMISDVYVVVFTDWSLRLCTA